MSRNQIKTDLKDTLSVSFFDAFVKEEVAIRKTDEDLTIALNRVAARLNHLFVDVLDDTLSKEDMRQVCNAIKKELRVKGFYKGE